MVDIVIMGLAALACCAMAYMWLDYHGLVGRTTGRVAIELVVVTAVAMFMAYCLMSVALDMVSLRMLYAAG